MASCRNLGTRYFTTAAYTLVWPGSRCTARVAASARESQISRSVKAPATVERACGISSTDRPYSCRSTAKPTTVRSAVSAPASTIAGMALRVIWKDRSAISTPSPRPPTSASPGSGQSRKWKPPISQPFTPTVR